MHDADVEGAHRAAATGGVPGGQRPEAMDDERTAKQLARPRPSPAPAESPSGERQPKRAQRALYPLGRTHPPPSPPPSPPQSPGRGPSARAGAGRGSPIPRDRVARHEGAPIFPWAYHTSAIQIQRVLRGALVRSTLHEIIFKTSARLGRMAQMQEYWE
jgi:hypothetical protein